MNNLLNWLQRSKSSFRKVIIYDCEIVRCLPSDTLSPDLEYCKGWDDFDGMGISVICAYSSWDALASGEIRFADRYHIYLEDNLKDFPSLIEQAEEIVGFNSVAFDDKLCAANGIQVTTTYDLLHQVRIAAEMPPYYVKNITRRGYSLEALAQANLGYGKTGTGETAPELWQRGQKGKVIDYCLNDVILTRKLYERRFNLTDPSNGKTLKLP